MAKRLLLCLVLVAGSGKPANIFYKIILGLEHLTPYVGRIEQPFKLEFQSPLEGLSTEQRNRILDDIRSNKNIKQPVLVLNDKNDILGFTALASGKRPKDIIKKIALAFESCSVSLTEQPPPSRPRSQNRPSSRLPFLPRAESQLRAAFFIKKSGGRNNVQPPGVANPKMLLPLLEAGEKNSPRNQICAVEILPLAFRVLHGKVRIRIPEIHPPLDR